MTTPAWTAEREITAEAAQTVIDRLFPDLIGCRASSFARGWDNTAVLLTPGEGTRGTDLLFRFPRRQVALAGIRRELDWLPWLAPQLPLPLPAPRYQGVWATESDPEPWPFWGGLLLAGRELAGGDPVASSEVARIPVAAAVARFLRSLHTLPVSGSQHETGPARAALQLDPLARADPGRRAARTRESLKALERQGLDVPVATAATLLDEAEAAGAPDTGGVICHGDLHGRHALVTSDEEPGSGLRVAGIIDWGDLCLGDPAIDLSIAYGAFSGQARDAFFDEYGGIDRKRELRARALALFLNVILAEYAIAEGGAVDEAVASIRRAVDG